MSELSDKLAQPCRVCGHSTTESRWKVANQTLDQCETCKFVQVRNKPDAATIAAIYSETYFAHAKYCDPQALHFENTRRLELLKPYLPENATLLDAGCSIGDFIDLAKKTYQCSGTDISEYAIKLAAQRHPELASRLEARPLEGNMFGGQQFDAICMWDVIEHLWDPAPVLENLLGRLKPGGHLFISTPAIDAPIARAMGRYWAFMTPPEHLSFFTKKSFYRLFREKENTQLVTLFRRGKWANLGFIGYKFRRVAPQWTQNLSNIFSHRWLRHRNVYVPTRDVQYLVVRKLITPRGG